MRDLIPALLEALSALPACIRSSFVREEIPLPVVVLENEGGSVLSRADGQPYLEEYLTAVDVYAHSREEAEALARQADAALTALGLKRTFQQDLYEDAAFAFRKSLRYRCVLCGDTIYQ